MRAIPQRLLYVHPDQAQRDAFQAAFGYGFRVTLVASGKAAVRAATRFDFPLVLIDDRIRDTDPWTLVEMISPVRRNAAFVIIVDGARPYRQASRPVAVTLTHPWSDDEMQRMLGKVSEKQRRWAAPVTDAARKRVLLLENASDAEEVRGMLNRLGWSVTHVTSMDKALDALEEQPYRVIFTGVKVRGSEGTGAVRTLTAAAPATPVIVLTEHGDPVLESQCVRVGAQDCIVGGSGNLVLLGRILRHSIERHAAMRRDQPQPKNDPVTGLMNRQGFLDVVHRTLSRCRRTNTRFAVLHLDVDRFKAIRERLGREASGELLRVIGDRLTEGVRVYDAVARVGQDEFGLVLDDLKTQGEEERIVERLLQSLSDTIQIGSRRVNIAASVGVAIFPEAGDSVTGLLEKAECAMHTSKSSGGSSFSVYVPEARRAQLELMAELQDALEYGRLGFDYQPQFRLSDGKLVGFEALLRWRRGDGQVISPGEFLPVLEETGLIHEVGTRSIGWALSRIGALRAHEGHEDVRVAVNLAACQFENPDLVRHVEAALSAYGLPSSALELEITEGLLMQDTDRTRDTLIALKALGVRIAIDDFGTGYSSLAYLRRFSVDVLKVDRSFVSELCESEEASTIADAIIGLGRRLGLEIVAEGIETPGQRDRLIDFGCEIGQGYLLGRPGPMEDFAEMGGGFAIRLTG